MSFRFTALAALLTSALGSAVAAPAVVRQVQGRAEAPSTSLVSVAPAQGPQVDSQVGPQAESAGRPKASAAQPASAPASQDDDCDRGGPGHEGKDHKGRGKGHHEKPPPPGHGGEARGQGHGPPPHAKSKGPPPHAKGKGPPPHAKGAEDRGQGRGNGRR